MLLASPLPCATKARKTAILPLVVDLLMVACRFSSVAILKSVCHSTILFPCIIPFAVHCLLYTHTRPCVLFCVQAFSPTTPPTAISLQSCMMPSIVQPHGLSHTH
jgi:hypothetical protein